MDELDQDLDYRLHGNDFNDLVVCVVLEAMFQLLVEDGNSADTPEDRRAFMRSLYGLYASLEGMAAVSGNVPLTGLFGPSVVPNA